MREVIYLTADKYGVKKMTKSLPAIRLGEIPIKLELVVDEAAFREPVIETAVHIEDWRQGIDIADVEFKEHVITEEEAEIIRRARTEKMIAILGEQGYQITKQGKDS